MTIMKYLICRMNNIDHKQYEDYEFDVDGEIKQVTHIHLWKTSDRYNYDELVIEIPPSYKGIFFIKLDRLLQI